ncbi:tRNA (N6-threonylcarbamoyladenosine(37)-N6)-methyltransferase TrmO [Haloferax sp. S1W]|uniref:tRNA (N6-threonylcarbamoyladenosine(37)-N6)-methyltransferase TrmO n=1 Tax=Haloferax sp. S1W TaxID=3377110 RepID=UPI0037C5C328
MTDTDQQDTFRLDAIGVVHSPYETPTDAPHQGFADDAESELEIFETYADALAGIEDVLRVTVVYWADQADRSEWVGDDGVGAFARRSPNRPNPLNICTCTVLETDSRRMRVRGLDAVDGSPLVDIKPAIQAER